MIRAAFRLKDTAASFVIMGHAGGESGTDIVCAAVSSAAYMAANTVTEILGVNAETTVSNGYLQFSCKNSRAAADVIRGLRLHLEQLQTDYPARVKVITEE